MNDTGSQSLGEQHLVEELRLVLKSLFDRARAGERPRLVDARSFLRNKLTLDFADYFKFLKRYNYLAISRGDQSLAVTEEGRRLVEQGASPEFLEELREHFSSQLEAQEQLIDMPEEEAFAGMEAPVEERPAAPAARHERRNNRPAEHPAAARGSRGESRYTRYDAIGTGGLGTVYRARHNALLIDVAIKEIKELFSYFNFLQRSEVVRHLKDAVEKMALLHHPQVVKVLDANTEVAHPYFVMELLPGGSLRQKLDDGRLELERALILFTQIVYALRDAHAQGVIHGNLKPENVLFDSLGNCRLTDFGMTSLLHTESNRAVPQLVTGSIAYLSPEQMKDRSVMDRSSDVYALGIMFYEMLTGHIPGRRSPLPSKTDKNIPTAADEIFEKMTADDPAERYPGFEEVLDDFYARFPAEQFLSKGRLILFNESGRRSDEDDGGEQA